MFDSLSEKLQETLSGVRGRGALTEDDITRAMREIRLALLEADVNFKVVKQFTSAVKERCLGAEVSAAAQPRPAGRQDRQRGADGADGRRLGRPVVLAAPADGDPDGRPAGLRQDDRRPPSSRASCARSTARRSRVAACDVYRPAAVEQLVKVGGQAGATVYERGTDADPVEIAAWARDQAERDGKDVLIVDTAGRLHVDEALMDGADEDQADRHGRRTCCSSSTP